MTDNYIHLGDFENFARNRFKNIVDGKGPIIPRIAVKIALDDIFKEDAVLIKTMHSDGEKQCNCVSGRAQSTGGCPIHSCTF